MVWHFSGDYRGNRPNHPPVGFNLFVLQSMTGKQITYIARVCAPYFALMMLALTLLWFFPAIVTMLPSKM